MNAPKMNDDALAHADLDREWIGPIALRRLRKLIAGKLDGRDAQERAAVFADALHRMVQSRLPELAEAEKEALRLRLVHQLCSEKGSLTDRDVLEECLRMHQLKGSGLEAVADWIAARTGSKPTPHELSNWSELARANLPLLNIMPRANADIQADVAVEPNEMGKWRSPGWFRHAAVAGLLLALVGFGVAVLTYEQSSDTLVLAEETTIQTDIIFLPAAPQAPLMENGLPRHFQHRYVNMEQLQNWLIRKQSKLAEEPYFTTMLDISESFNLHPYLLFAVSGQENGYVQIDNPEAEQIANNPFNVYHSWWEYNTDIADSSRIAAKTIVRLSLDQPEDMHPFQWINREYAEDPNWWQGVKAIFEQMERDIPLRTPN